ncbi:MAG: FliA/WhiG family RNA polymerase sigma factor [Cyanobacteriota bacterium]
MDSNTSKSKQNPDPKKARKLSEAKVAELWNSYYQNKNKTHLRETIILNYIHLVKYVVGRLVISLPVSISNDDLMGYGIEGLIEAVDRFDPQRGLKFETYAITRIRGAIIDNLRSQDWVPRGVRKRTKDLQEAITLLEQKLGRTPTESELSEALGVSKAKLAQLLAESSNLLLSLDERKEDSVSQGGVSLIDTIVDKDSPDPQSEYEALELKNNLSKAIGSLPEREKMVIALYYHENMTLKEIGQVINVSESRVCQLHAQAIMRLRSKLSG